MAFWDRDDEGEWEKHQKSRKKEEDREKPSASDEFRAYFKTKRMASLPDGGEGGQPGEQDTPLKTFLSRIRRDKPEEEGEGPPEKCPWCGGDMIKGYLQGGRGFWWQKKKPTFFSTNGFSSETVNMSEQGNFGWDYKTVWHCPACFKMVTDIRGLDPPLGEKKPEQYGLGSANPADAEERGGNGKSVPENETEET